jgi:hypothetical protein
LQECKVGKRKILREVTREKEKERKGRSPVWVEGE